MHQNLTEHGKFYMQNNQLLTKSQVELKDNSIATAFSRQEYVVGFNLNAAVIGSRKIGRGRHLLISSDPISFQVFITFLNILRTELVETQFPFHRIGKEKVCDDVLGKDGFDLAWIQSPLLNKSQITPYLREWNVKILFINKGAWFQSDSTFVKGLTQIFLVLEVQYPHLLVIYRNSPPGHKGCINLHIPLDQPQEKHDLPYHWGEFVRQNKIARTMVEKAAFIFLDVDSMLRLRPDRHLHPPKDCLHFSIPGALDIVFHLFYNTISLLDRQFQTFPFTITNHAAGK